MMAPAMTTPADERIAYASLARQGARVERDLQADALERLAQVAPGVSSVAMVLDFRRDESGRSWVSGHVEQTVAITCQRCLEPLERRLAVDIELCIVRDGSAIGELAGQTDVLMADADTVSIADIVEDELLLGLPERLCQEEPCGLAPPFCYPAAEQEAVDAAAAAASPFSILARLKGADA
jgi:uncharacterized protein